MAVRLTLCLLVLLSQGTLADPPGFTDADADRVLHRCVVDAPDGAGEPHRTCRRAMRALWAKKEPLQAGSGPGLILLAHHAVGAWRRKITARYDEILTALEEGADVPLAARAIRDVQALRRAWPEWVAARCAPVGSLGGGDYDHLYQALCEEEMSALHWVDLLDLETIVPCKGCQ